jgi:hypothetical protein
MATPGLNIGKDFDVRKPHCEFATNVFVGGNELNDILWKRAFTHALDICIDFINKFKAKDTGYSPSVPFIFCEFITALTTAELISNGTFDCALTNLYLKDYAGQLRQMILDLPPMARKSFNKKYTKQ